jgi:branched-subunit amino acid transport protein
MSTTGDLWPYLIMIFVGFLPNEIWRMFGLVMARNIDEGSELLIWVRAVATAVLAGVIAKILFFPPGALAGVTLSARLLAIGCGLAAYWLARRSVFAGVATGVMVLIIAGSLSPDV